MQGLLNRYQNLRTNTFEKNSLTVGLGSAIVAQQNFQWMSNFCYLWCLIRLCTFNSPCSCILVFTTSNGLLTMQAKEAAVPPVAHSIIDECMQEVVFLNWMRNIVLFVLCYCYWLILMKSCFCLYSVHTNCPLNQSNQVCKL